MNTTSPPTTVFTTLYALVALACFVSTPAPLAAEEVLDPDSWPRTFETGGTEIAVYMPQILEWSEFRQLKATSAIGIKFAGQDEVSFGAVVIEAQTVADFVNGTVMVGKREWKDFRFPEMDAPTAAKAEELIRSVFSPDAPMEIPLDTVTSALERSGASVDDVAVNFDPPPIFHSDSPAVLVSFIGEPKLESVNADDPSTLFAINTNWDVLFDGSDYYLLNGNQWLATKDLMKGPWIAATKIPDSFRNLPDDDNWSEVKANLIIAPEAPAPPKVFVSDRPAEMILTDGKPQMVPISGTSLMYFSNTDSDLFFHAGEKLYYLLSTGRWFRSPSLDGPWETASDSLPEDFAHIPSAHAKGYVLASVVGSAEADEAVILASIPQTATVDRSTTTIAVAYEGEPEFKPIVGSKEVQFAVNTSNDVFLVEGAYYCCFQGVWFFSRAARGPWIVCDKVPEPIYTIPAESPKYNVTYVHVYGSTPATVQVGYTSGYEGNYIARGLVVFGLGMWIGHELSNNYWHGRYFPSPYWYGYGCGAVYRPGYGYYRRGASYYGPYGGAGYGAKYNPATGVYSRGAYAYGPRGAVGARTAYNPWTNTAAGRVGVRTPYGSWGRSAVVRDDEWIRAGHRSNPYGTVGGIQTSNGGVAVGIDRKYGSDSVFGKTGNGDVYVGKDGKVYKKDADGGWQKRENGGWQVAPKVPTASPYAARRDDAARSGAAKTRPSQPSDRPSPPVTRPAVPENRPARPSMRPDQPTTRPAQPTTRPAQPTTRPAQPTTRPAQPTTRPAQPTTRPAQPTTRPAQPTARPAQPSGNRGNYTNRQSTPAQLNRDSYSRSRSSGASRSGGASRGGGRRR